MRRILRGGAGAVDLDVRRISFAFARGWPSMTAARSPASASAAPAAATAMAATERAPRVARSAARPIDYRVDPARGDAFYAEIRRYWPALPDGALQPAYSGVRPKLGGPEAPAADFVLQGPAEHGIAGLMNLFGIESPGLTSCLAIADEVLRRLGLQAAKT